MINATLNIENTELFKNALSILGEILKDERIPKNIRSEYIHKSSELLSPKNNNVKIMNANE